MRKYRFPNNESLAAFRAFVQERGVGFVTYPGNVLHVWGLPADKELDFADEARKHGGSIGD